MDSKWTFRGSFLGNLVRGFVPWGLTEHPHDLEGMIYGIFSIQFSSAKRRCLDDTVGVLSPDRQL
jgi:hypothetical protein